MNGDVRAYIALGSNRGDRRRNLERALNAMSAAGIRVVRISTFEETRPVGATGRRQFLNAVAEVATTLPPRTLLRRLRRIERQFGPRFAAAGGRSRPRMLDLDLILYGRARINTPELTLPHPRYATRSFVLNGLAEVAPSLRLPRVHR